jgi:hypothetical protein
MLKLEKGNLEFRLSRYGIKLEYKKMPYFNLIFNWKKPDIITQGITNRCSDGNYVLFLDYDQVYLSTVLEDIQAIRRKFGICSFFIFRSSKIQSSLSEVYSNWFVYSVCKVNYKTIKEILKNVRVDESYLKGDYYHKAFVLRFESKYFFKDGEELGIFKSKPTFYGLKLYNSCKFQHSKAHLKALEVLFGLKVPKNLSLGKKASPKKFDNSKFVEIVTYPTMVK